MSWDIAVAGSVTFDKITTPRGHRDHVMGGSAVYFSLSACRYSQVHMSAVVGEDGEEELASLCQELPIDRSGVSVSPMPTFRSHLEHDFNTWMTSSVRTEPGAYVGWHPRLTGAAMNAPVLFIGSTMPALQREAQLQSNARLSGADSMAVFISEQHDAVSEVVQNADILFLDRRELSLLSGHALEDFEKGAKSLLGKGRLRAVVVKRGPLGATLVTQGTCLSMPAAPVPGVDDPTGAGDAFAGGFLGACARAERDDEAFFPEALHDALLSAAPAISVFGTHALRAFAYSERALPAPSGSAFQR